MINKETSEYENTLAYIKESLGISSGSIEKDTSILDNYYSVDITLRPDFILSDGDTTYLIKVRSKVTIDTVARMNLLRELWVRNEGRKGNLRLAIASKYFPEREKQMMEQLDITMIKLPWSFQSATAEQSQPVSHRVTAEKSWKIVSRLLKEKNSSIRQLSLLENVSYGWAHKTVQALIRQNIVKQDHSRVSISNTDKLLNGVAWERPLVSLKIHEIRIQFSESSHAAKEITETFAMQDDMPVGFTAYTAASLYTAYGVRHDSVYLYLKDEHIRYFRELFESSSGDGIKAIVYRPDRDVFRDTREKEGVRLVSPSQNLLDLAGMGYSAMDITKEMVSVYDKL
ncbi:hypothetical protein [Methanolobus chelungpuianus]|uniref:Uncharacterized protein n=1 Tax=Methanolobus chelungpuianus TaxID=502115 RepID=A0AAE3HBV2_9EURY|nr:hypothetical protein [Methanolobus chelungpuianus]MCQ6963294.1 hypothetical protein [Methanolobus chelungpuianus]